MSGIYYALSIVAVFAVILWFIRNDRKSPDENTTGLLAMRGLDNQTKSLSRSAGDKTAKINPNEK